MSRRVSVLACLLMAAFVIARPAQAAPIVVNWNNTAVTDTGAFTDFSDGTMLFAGFFANSLTDIAGSGFAHSHGGVTTVDIEILLNGVWTNLINRVVNAADGDLPLDSLVPPQIAFAAGTVTGLRILSNPNINQTFHGMFDETFTFNTAVPEPTSLLLLGSGIGLVARRLRRTKRAA